MSRRREGIAAFEGRLGHVFADRDLIDLALTHVSATSGENGRLGSYQRLEFLGDHVLGLAVSAMLYRAFPEADEGELSRRRADLVRRETCAEIAAAWQVGPHIRLGQGEAQTGGRRKAAILANVCESVIGAVFLDAGFEAAAALIERHFEPRMHAPSRPLRDPKTALQEWALARGLPPPAYREIDRFGPDHAPQFTVTVELPGLAAGEGRGKTKRAAEQDAAERLLEREGVAWTDPDA